MPPRQSPSNQNQQGKAPQAQPQTPMGGNQQVPQAAGNPRYQSGLGPDPNPKVVVKTVNPPITPDQVVSLAEQPSSAIELPNIKLQNIKIPPVKNKTIQGHLKAIEAKMIATEKLMKDVVKLQRLQIKTEKEIFERKRELYQNTFEEYIYDKTIDFEDPEDPDCTCINLPKGPRGPGGGGRRGGSPGVPVPAPVVVPSAQQQEQESATTPAKKTNPVKVPTTPGQNTPQKEKEVEDPFRFPQLPPFPPIIPFNPFEFDPFEFPGLPMGAAADIDPAAAFTNPELAKVTSGLFDYESISPLSFIDPKQDPAIAEVEEFRTWVPQEQVPSPLLAFVPDAIAAYEANGKTTTSVDTPHGKLYVGFKNTFDRTPVFKYLTNTGNAQRMAETAKTLDNPFVSSVLTGTQGLNFVGDLMIGTRGGVGAASRGPYGINSYGRKLKPLNFNVNLKNPFRRRNMDINDPAFDFDLATMEAAGYTSPQLRSTLIKDGVDMPTTVREPQPGITVIQRGNIDATGAMGLNNPSPPASKQASGGMGSMDLYNSGAKQYFRKISNDMNIPKFGGGGFNLLNPMSWFRGDLKKVQEGELENVSNDTFAGKLYNRRKQQEEMMRKLRGYQSGGIVDWWNMGRNARVPAENSASWRTLMADDAKQITRSNKAFRSGATGIRGWNPIKAFTPEMVRTGPTPAVRQAFERPVRFVRDQIVRSAVSSVVKPMIRPLLKPLVAASGLILATPSPAGGALYGPGAVDPKYRNVTSREEFDKLEAAQNSMMSGSDNQQPQVMPLPPDYIKIPGKTPPKQMDTFVVPGIDKPSSMFTRSTTFID